MRIASCKRSSEEKLIEELEEHSIFQKLKLTDKILFLYLDSLDEALLNIKLLGKSLLRWLSKLNLSKLRLRITCRSAVWTDSAIGELKKLFGEENVAV